MAEYTGQTISVTGRTITRDDQEAEVFYVDPRGYTFVSPDGIGRYYYDTLGDAIDQHGDGLDIVNCAGWED